METLTAFFFLFLTLGFILIFSLSTKPQEKTQTKPSSNPTSYPLIGSILSFNKNRHRLLQWYTDLLRLSPSQTITVDLLFNRRTIVTANPENVEHILKTNFSNFPKGKPFTDLLGDLLGGGIFNSDGELWSSQRKLASHEFTMRSLKEFTFEILREEVENRLVPVLSSAADYDGGRTVDLQEILKRFAFDIVCKVSLGWDPDCLDLTRPVPALVEAFDVAAAISARRATEPVHAVWKLKRLLNVGSERRLREAIKTVHVSVSEIIRAKKKSLALGGDVCDKKDLLSRFLAAGHGEEAVRDSVISFIMAGRDTTSAAMTWLFWLLSENVNVEDKILEEVRNKEALGFEDLREMSYTKACLCEAMRLYPPVAWDSKHAANDDVLPDGTRVRKGDKVTYFPYGMGRMEKVWGQDWDEFKPNRWFEEKPSTGPVLKSVSSFKFPVFQAGPRVCIGKEMAFTQMKYVVGSVLSRFEIIPVSKNRPVFVPLLTAHMAGGLKVKIKRREH
ncbi:unnamed protein product [Eruca vesicaria subsp. sativa]|uniref:Cytochrome P450 n=1 Tax=Eruca vesicaria subsp. sativa TaxID=29727 RepID=A0ABC8JJU1_ERUVS|nr:unnamed protein product [Eruca vesicaria subsp. sativa]